MGDPTGHIAPDAPHDTVSARGFGADSSPLNGGFVHEDDARGLFRVNREALISDDVFEAERRKVFDKVWLYVGHESEVPRPGDFVTRTVAGRPVILCRHGDGSIKVLLNVCRHRGAEVCRDAAGNSKTFKCFYHAWTYDTSGALVGVPGRDAFGPGFDERELGLVSPAGVEAYRGFVFTTFEPEADTLRDYLGRAREYLDYVIDQSEAGMRILPGTHEYSIRANWKLLVENSIDGYHLVPLHRTYFSFVRRTEGKRVDSKRRTHAIDLGGGHAVILDHAPWGRPVARWAPSFGEWARAPIEARQKALRERFGEERAEMIGNTDRNLLIFPNLVINDVMGVVVRTLWPVAADHHLVSAWALAPTDIDERFKEVTLNSFISFLGPGGLATPDDMEALESCQRGFATHREVQWSDISRGMKTPQDEVTSADEVQIRAFWRRWNDLITA